VAERKDNGAADTSDREIGTTRLLDAPRELVWKAWTDPTHVAQWWGPNGFTNTITEMDVRPGGIWRFIMHGPDGTNYPNRIAFIEVAPPERLVYVHGDDEEHDQFHVTVTFEKEGSKTKLTMRSLFKTKAHRDYVVEKHGAAEGMQQTLSRLTEYLSTMSGEELLIAREFDAPRAAVWKAWTDAAALAEWLGPKNFTIRVVKLELKPGRIFHYSMRAPDGRDMWGRFEYREIVPPERLVVVYAFADAKSDIAPNPWLPEWPRETLNVLTLTEKDGKTQLTLRGKPLNATEAQLKAFAGLRGSMQQGFKGTFDQLADYLAKS